MTVNDLASVKTYVRHRLWREGRVLEVLAQRADASPGELVPDVYDDVPSILHAFAERSLLAHLEKLVRGVEAAGLRMTGNPIYPRYNAPFVPWFMRRNEIWLKLA